VPLPPEHLSLFRAGQLRKRWHYVSFWSPELSFCAARTSVGPLQQEYWGLWDRATQQIEALIEHRDNFLFVQSDYFHWFGTYRGTLPGGIELREAHGLRERHDALW
jgi:hypothetical protein